MKKLLVLFAILLAAFTLVACEDDTTTYTYDDVLESIEIGYEPGDSINHVTQNITLPSSSSLDLSATLTWESAHEDLISSTGEVNRPLEDVEAILILSLRVGSVSKQEFFILTVKGTNVYYNVTFDIEGVEQTSSVLSGTVLSEPIEVPSKENHLFVGWFVGDVQYNFSSPVTSDLDIVAVFAQIQSAEYAIEFYEQRVDDDTYRRLSNEILIGTPGETITLNRSKEGFVVNTELSILTGVVTADSPLVLKVYFDRMTYEITYKNNVEVIGSSEVKFGAKITPIEAPVVNNYEFVGWYLNDEFTTPFDSNLVVTEDVTLYAKYEEVTEGDYTVIIYEENINDDLYTQTNNYTYTVEFGTLVTYTESKTGFIINEEMSVVEGTLAFGVELTLEVYYERIRYNVEFIDDELVYQTTVKYGGVITPIDDLVEEGYEFVGWTRTQNGSNEYNFDLPVTSEIILYSIWIDLNAPVYEGYYAALNGLMNYEIKSKLTQIITPMNDRGYTTAITILQNSDRDPNNANNLILVYDRISRVSTWASGATGTWNREHVWPQSKLGTASDSDAHNLKPADPQTNSTRSNTIFADGSGNARNVSGGWYPGDQDKGDIARIVLYMNVRWGLAIGTSSIGSLDTFLKWHIEDPVDDFESNRNDVIYSWQNNRNPFIDHPELVERIWGTVTLSSGDNVSLSFYSHENFVEVSIDVYDLPTHRREKEFYQA
ncbi:MAG: endonuclease [Acholeplasmataceae bacterium]|jgi:uncharacterized repeat protein (TIGR02543 family)|nr:endonuclease [Acholeplasmataceae bacterium]